MHRRNMAYMRPQRGRLAGLSMSFLVNKTPELGGTGCDFSERNFHEEMQ